MTDRIAPPWWWSGAALPALLVGATATLLAAAWSRLPDPVAVHWGAQGPDGRLPLAVFAAIVLGAEGVAWAALVAARRSRTYPWTAAVLCFVLGLLGAVVAVTVLANLDAASWTAAAGVSLWPVLGVVGFGAATAAAGAFLAGGVAGLPPFGPFPAAPRFPEAAVPAEWSGRSGSRWLPLVAPAGLVLGLVVGGLFLVVWIPVMVLALELSAVVVKVSRRGVSVGLGWWGWPRRTVPLESIVGADVVAVSPMAFGGYGYRFRPELRALITRRGEALRLGRRNRPDLLITVDDAGRGAAVVNRLVDAAAPEG